jgi:ABC-type spermidine/putrescine transport system permease subunit II
VTHKSSKTKKSTAMKNLALTSLRVAALAVTLLVLPAAFAQNPDRIAQALAARGSVRVDAVGPDVNVGTCRVQVFAQLGSPTSTLPDGTWLYQDYLADGSEAHGTLVVHFNAGRVSSLSLASPAVVVALRNEAKRPGEKVLVAAR